MTESKNRTNLTITATTGSNHRVVTFKLNGYLTKETLDTLKDTIQENLIPEHRHLIFNLKYLFEIDYTSLNFFLKLYMNSFVEGRFIHFIETPEEISEEFELVHLHTLVQITKSGVIEERATPPLFRETSSSYYLLDELFPIMTIEPQAQSL